MGQSVEPSASQQANIDTGGMLERLLVARLGRWSMRIELEEWTEAECVPRKE